MNFVERLKKHEGFRSRMYEDTVGVKTIGYGFNLETIKLPRPVAELWLAFEIEDKENQLETLEWYNDLDPIRQEVILDMCFNLGFQGLLKFKNMIQAIRDENYVKAAAEMLDSKWASQVGQRAIRLSEMMGGLK